MGVLEHVPGCLRAGPGGAAESTLEDQAEKGRRLQHAHTAAPLTGFPDLEPDFGSYRGQYVLARRLDELPAGWSHLEASGWHLAVNQLPAHPLTTRGRFLGWCVGWPLTERLELDPDDPEGFYARTGGPWALLLVGEGKVMLDSAGLMPAVYHLDRDVVASTPTLIANRGDFDISLAETVGFPHSGGWFPFGLTAHARVRRLLPNHELNLGTRAVRRHWPEPHALCEQSAVAPLVKTIHDTMAESMRRAALEDPLQLTLTAGRDSRMVLAAARGLASDATFVTFYPARETHDSHVAQRLAGIGRLDHELIEEKRCSDAEANAWLLRTGHGVSGAIWRIHKTLEALDPGRTLVVGVCGEVGRGYYYSKGDRADRTLTAEVLLARMGLPKHERLIGEATQWIQSLPSGLGYFNSLDMAYIEQRLGCWAAPQRFGNLTSVFEFSPFCHRRVFESMLRLPVEYRWRDELPEDICGTAWPELLAVPYNRFTGLRGVRDELILRTKRAVKAVLRTGRQ